MSMHSFSLGPSSFDEEDYQSPESPGSPVNDVYEEFLKRIGKTHGREECGSFAQRKSSFAGMAIPGDDVIGNISFKLSGMSFGQIAQQAFQQAGPVASGAEPRKGQSSSTDSGVPVNDPYGYFRSVNQHQEEVLRARQAKSELEKRQRAAGSASRPRAGQPAANPQKAAASAEIYPGPPFDGSLGGKLMSEKGGPAAVLVAATPPVKDAVSGGASDKQGVDVVQMVQGIMDENDRLLSELKQTKNSLEQANELNREQVMSEARLKADAVSMISSLRVLIGGTYSKKDLLDVLGRFEKVVTTGARLTKSDLSFDPDNGSGSAEEY